MLTLTGLPHRHLATLFFNANHKILSHYWLYFRNLQAAVCCYFDFVASSNANALQPMPSMRIVRELTVGLGESVTPSTQFSQSWLIENNGRVPWPQGCYLKLVTEIDDDRRMEIPPVAPNDTYVLTVNLVSPAEIGQFRSQFRLCTPTETTIGPIIWSVVDVSPSGTLALTQQMNQLHTNNSALQVQQPYNQDEIAMQSSDAQNAPHCSSVPGGFANPNQVSFGSFKVWYNLCHCLAYNLAFHRLFCQHRRIRPITHSTRRWWPTRWTLTTCSCDRASVRPVG